MLRQREGSNSIKIRPDMLCLISSERIQSLNFIITCPDFTQKGWKDLSLVQFSKHPIGYLRLRLHHRHCVLIWSFKVNMETFNEKLRIPIFSKYLKLLVFPLQWYSLSSTRPPHYIPHQRT